MPTYDYECQDCSHEFEQFHGFNDTPSPCEKCNSENVEIVVNQAPVGFVKGEPTTLGQLAESNTKNMGRYELEAKRAKQEKGNLKNKEPKEWWRKSGNASQKEIGKMSKAQKAKYIQGGNS
mgnify:CR=1 FL=1|jgi:putative FmdB family regulatory protein|tara:strand:- start:692 stop:1054 length:363 start_codon:yes stop_codon:yes gene_type:complete